MRTQSAKAKGRRLQQWVANLIVYLSGVPAEQATSRSMGAGGTDVHLAGSARELFPFAIECKNVERINLWSAWEQAQAHALAEKDLEPLVIIKRNGSDPVVVMDARFFFESWITRRD